MMNPFLEKLNALEELELSLLSRIALFINYRILSKNDYLQKPGQFVDNIYFIDSGTVMRFHKLGDRKIYTDFFGKGDIIFDISGFMTQQRSNSYLWAHKAGTVFYIPRNHYNTICEEFPHFQRYVNKLLALNYLSLEAKFNILRARPCDRVAIFQQTYSTLFDSIPKEYITIFCSISNPTLRRGIKPKT